MKQLLGSLAEGTIFKMDEGGTLAEFVVARHDYGSGENGTGHTLIVRKTVLAEKRKWANYDTMSAPTNVSWASHSTLRTWLEEEYAKNFSEDFLAKVKPLTIRYGYEWGTAQLKDAKFFVPRRGDDFAESAKEAIDGETYWTRDAEDDTYSTNDDPPITYEYGEVFAVGIGWVETLWDGHGVLPCFALYDDMMLEDGVLRVNHAPEIVSFYFGTSSVHGKKTPFKLPYSVHDADGDTVTVTEKLDGEVVRTFTAVDGATNRFSVTQEMLDKLDGETDHELTVTASDGAAETVKKYTFRKIIGSGYVVYIGKIAGTEDKTGYYWTEREVLHDAGREEMPFILDPEVTLEANDLGSFVFTIPAVNPHYDKIGLKTTVISVEEDGSEIFMGYVTEMNKQFNLDIEVTCEGELGYLQDRDCIIEEKTYTSKELLTLAVTADERFAEEGKAFNLGEVTKEKTGTDKDEEESKTISDCWSVAKNYLADKYGGYLRLRKTVKMENDILVYHRYLDYLDDVPDQTDQVIQFGVNLLDVSYYLKANEIVNSIVVIGYETTGWFIFSSTKEIRVEVKNEESIKKYGLCQRYMTVDGTGSTTASLTEKGEEEMKKHTNQFEGSLTINSADLADVGVDVDRLQFLKQTRVISEEHGLSNWILCTKEVIPLDAPSEKEFTFGGTNQNLSALQASNFNTAGRAWDMIQSTVKYVKNGG